MSGQIFITRNGEETAYAKPLKRAVLRDKRLTFGARGLFCMLWDFPNNWSFYASHIVSLSPGGVTQLRSYMRELKQFGALQIVAKKINAVEATALSAESEKSYKAGQIIGKQWILNHPDMWAVEASLSKKPNDRFSDVRQTGISENLNDAFSEPKGFQTEGDINNKVLPLPKSEFLIQREYAFPAQLSLKEREIAETLLSTTDVSTAQAILDELAARLIQNKIHSAPLSYLRSLIKSAETGRFIPEAGIAIALKREKLLKEQNSRHDSKSTHKPKPVDLQKQIQKMHETLRKGK